MNKESPVYISEIMTALTDLFTSMPPILGALLTFIAGWIIAKLFQILLPKILSFLKFDRLSEKLGIVNFLKKGNVEYAPSKLAGMLVYWFLMIIVLSNTLAVLDTSAAASLSDWLRLALPRIIAAFLIVIIGVVIVSFLSNFFITIAKNAAIHNPILIGKIISYVGYIILGTMVLEQLGLGQTIVSTLLLILFAAIAFGLALAIGLGCKDMARKLIEDFVRNFREKERLKHGSDLEG